MVRIFNVVMISCLVALASYVLLKRNADRVLMRFFRDLSRYKSRKRLYGNQAALIPMLMGKEEKIELLPPHLDNPDGFTITPEELSEMDGRSADTPIYLSVLGHVYDVSAAPEKYGPTGNYRGLAARDSTVSFALGCLEGDTGCATLPHIDTLTAEDFEEAARWAELYHNHDKYTYVGELVASVVDPVVEKGVHDKHSAKDEEHAFSHSSEGEVDTTFPPGNDSGRRAESDFLSSESVDHGTVHTNDDIEHVVHLPAMAEL